MELILSLNENTHFGEVTYLEKEMMYMGLKKISVRYLLDSHRNPVKYYFDCVYRKTEATNFVCVKVRI